MQITPRAIVLAVALLASAPLLAAGSDASITGTSTVRSDASTQEAQATTEQDNCTLPKLPPADLAPDKLAGLLPKPGSTPTDPFEVDRRLGNAASCARALGLWAPGEGTTTTTAKETTGSTSNGATGTQSSSAAGI